MLTSATFWGFTLTAIIRLLRACCPSAIRRLVRTVIVDTVQSHSGWAWTHVAEERGKVIAPSVADVNTSTAVIWVSRIGRFMASALHHAPSVVFRALPHAVFAGAISKDRTLEASAGFGMRSPKAHLSNNGLISAFALAYPRANWFRAVIVKTDNREATYDLSGKIEWFTHTVTVA